MKRRLFTLASVVSLLLTFAVITTWIRSYLTTDVIVRTTRDGRHFEFATIPGQIRLTFTKGWPRQADPRWYSGDLHWYTGRFPAYLIVLGQRPIYAKWYPLGYAIHDWSGPDALAYRTYAIPYYLPLALTLILPAWMTIRLRRMILLAKSRAARGLCVRCGYDLRASSGRCPECGAGRETPGTPGLSPSAAARS